MGEEGDDKLREHLEAAMDRLLRVHGYGFQYAVIQAAMEAAKTRAIDWWFEVAEFPAAVQGEDTRVDFILRKRQSRLFMVAECKRSEVNRSHWGFVRGPFNKRGGDTDEAIYEHVRLLPAGGGPFIDPLNRVRSAGARCGQLRDLGHHAFDLKLPKKKGECAPDEGGRVGGRNPIDVAAAQLLRGING